MLTSLSGARPGQRRTLVVVVVLSSVGACSHHYGEEECADCPPVSSQQDGGEGGAPFIDGAPPDAAPGEAASPVDAGDGCTLLIDDSFASQSPSWGLLGSSTFSPGRVVLTPKGAGAVAGAVWWKAPITLTGELRVTVDISIDSSGVTAGDGITIGWATASGLGQSRQSFGLCNGGLTGTGVAFDSWDSQLLLLSGISSVCETKGGVANVQVGARQQQLKAFFSASSISGAVDNATLASKGVVNTTTGYIGITAATGNGASEHAITSVRVASCE